MTTIMLSKGTEHKQITTDAYICAPRQIQLKSVSVLRSDSSCVHAQCGQSNQLINQTWSLPHRPGLTRSLCFVVLGRKKAVLNEVNLLSLSGQGDPETPLSLWKEGAATGPPDEAVTAKLSRPILRDRAMAWG